MLQRLVKRVRDAARLRPGGFPVEAGERPSVQTADAWRGLTLPVPRRVGVGLVVVTSALALLTVLTLAVRGLGAPFAIALSRRLATDWLYAWTRNPMVLATLAWLVAIGLYLRSALFVLWVVGLVAPAWIAFLKVYE